MTNCVRSLDAPICFCYPKEGLTRMSTQSDYAGMAALSICEALLLAMNDQGLMPEQEIVGVLRDAATSHENAVSSDADRETHLGVARLINLIIAGGNSVRRP